MSKARDYPFYNGQPAELGRHGWLIVVTACVAAFLLLILLPLGGPVLGLVPALLFSVIPLASLAFVVGPRWKALFGSFGFSEALLAVGFGLLTLVLTFMVGLLLSQFVDMRANPATLQEGDAVGLWLLLARAAIQLVGEEAVTILPLLAVMWVCFSRLGWSRGWSLLAGVVVSTAWFAAMHLPTYDWNLVQCFGGIGAARLVLTAAYLVTRNMAVSIGAHIVNDWTMFVIGFAGSHLPVGVSPG